MAIIWATKDISEGSTDIVSVDLTAELDNGETAAASATVAESGTSDLTLTNLAGTPGQATVSTTSLTINAQTVATGQAVRWLVSGQKKGITYVVNVTMVTDGSPARTLKRSVQLVCK